MRLALCLILISFASCAIAGPALIAAGEWIATHYIIAQIALTVALAVYGSAQQRRAARHAQEDAKRAFNASLQDRAITVVSAEAPDVYIYGRARVGSAIVAMFTSGDKDQYKHLVCVHAAHECDGVEAIFVNGQDIVALDGSGNVTGRPFAVVSTVSAGVAFGSFGGSGEAHSGASFSLDHTPLPGTLTLLYTITTGAPPYSQVITTVNVPYTLAGNVVTPIGYSGPLFAHYQYQNVTPRLRVNVHLGGSGDPVDANLHAELPDKWPSSAVLRGRCYSVVRLDLNQPEFQNGIPPIEILLRGKRLYDPRDASTIWNDNPALAIRDYLTSEMCGVPSSDIPDSAFITAANVCDETQSFGKRYTINGTVSSDHAQKDVLESMAQSMAGSIVSTTWEINAGKYVAPVAALLQSDIVGTVAVNPGISDADVFNGVRGQFISSENLYVPTDFTPYQNSAYVTADGGEQWSDINFPWTNSLQRVQNLARIFTEDQRNAYTMKAELSLKAWSRKIGERVTFTSAYFSQAAKIFRITDKKYTPNGIVELTLKEDASSIWDFADAVSAGSLPGINVPNPFAISAPMNFVLESGTNALLIQSDGSVISRIHAIWSPVDTQAVITNGTVEVEWIKVNDLIGHKIAVSGSTTDAYLSPVEDGQYYEVRARTVNAYLNVKSDWAYAPLHLVLGKTEPPASILNFAIDGTVISWDPITDVDLAGYVFKYHYGNNLDWGSANLLYDGVITESPFDLQTLPYGVVTIMGKAVDTSGNESLITANIFANLGDPPVQNVVAVIAFDPTYPGSYSGCSVVAGDVVAAAIDSFYGTDDQSFFDIDSFSFYEPSAFGQMIYTSADFEIPIALAGSNTILDMTTEGGDVTVEYRYVGQGTFFGNDADPFYDADGDPFFQTPPGPWLAWPGAIVSTVDVYQMQVTVGAGPTQGKITTMSLIVDAPDMNEVLPNVSISAGGTAIPYTKPFTSIVSVQATLQANGSGAETIETDKTVPTAPVIRAFNSGHTSVSGATADITLQGY